MILQFTVVGGDPWINVTPQAWRSRYSSDVQIVHMQRSWDSASFSQATRISFDNARDDRDRARLLAVVEPHSGNWLHTSELSTGRMDPRVGSGRVGSRFCRILAGRVGSGWVSTSIF